MSKLFKLETEVKKTTGSLDSRLDSSTVLFVVFVLGDKSTRLSFTEKHPALTFKGYKFNVTEKTLSVNEQSLSIGLTRFEDLTLFVVSGNMIHTKFLVLPYHDFTFSNHPISAVRTKGDFLVNINQTKVTIYTGEDPVYFNDVRVETDVIGVDNFEVGFRIFTPEFYIERHRTQWKVTTFTEDLVFDHKQCLEVEEEVEFPTDFPDYRRSPRLVLEAPTKHVSIEKISSAPQERKNSLLKTIFPPLAMILGMVAMSALTGRNPIMMISMGLMSIGTTVGAITAYFTDKKGTKQKLKQREEDYNAYTLKKTAQISQLYDEEKRVLNYQQPSPQKLVELAQTYNSRLYERMLNNKDFLEVSLGTSEQATNLKLSYPNGDQEKDPALLHVQKVMAHFETQKDVPTKLEVMNQTVGLVGTYDILKTQVANLLFQLAFFQSYQDVNFITLVPERDYESDWASWRFLPHYKLQELSGLRGIVHDGKTRDMILNSFYRKLNERKKKLEEAGREKPQFLPYYVLTIFDDSYLAGHGLNELLATDTSELGLTVIYCKEDQKLLPETVTAMVEYYNTSAGQIVNDHKLYVSTDFRPYKETPQLEQAIRHIANLNHIEVEKNAIPETVTFLELYKVKRVKELNIEKRWSESDASKTLAVPIGLRGKDDIEILNLHEKADGPHGIFGGTTGAGKSEMAQSLLLSLAVNFAPEDVSFLIIDFKGGGMSALFRKLPHLTGEITNLDGAGVQRAITAFQAEIDKRQRYFDQYGVNNINDYTRLYRQGKVTPDPKKYPTEPLPHLIIVGDETAELKAKTPEFLDVLVSGARVGRSLGIHQFLGTQSPAGVISEQIWDNSKFKLSLRMADESASKSILKTADAAHLSTSEPGRAYLKVGTSERYELFQSAYSAAEYEPDKTVEKVEVRDDRIWDIDDLGQKTILNKDLSGEEEERQSSAEKYTELDAVVDYIANLVNKTKAKIPAKPWLPLLEDKIVTPPVENTGKRNTQIPLGLLDIPSHQSQETYFYDIQEDSHTVIYSSPGYGKSTTLQTIVMNLARQNTPEQVQFNLLDFGTNGLLPLKDLPHVADLTRLGENEKLRKMLAHIRQLLEERKQMFQKVGVASLPQFESKTKTVLPVVVNVLDNYDSVLEDENKRGMVDNLLAQVLREGQSLGVYLLISAGRPASIRMNMRSNVATSLSLFLQSDEDLQEVFGRERMPQTEIIGRGQARQDEVNIIQMYLPNDGKRSLDVVEGIESEVEQYDKSWDGPRPKGLPIVPEEYEMSYWQESQSVIAYRKKGLPLALALSDTRALGFDYKRHNFFLVSYTSEGQRFNQRAIILSEVKEQKGISKILFDFEKDIVDTSGFDAVFDDAGNIGKGIENLKYYIKHQGNETLVYITSIESFFKTTKMTAVAFKELVNKGSKHGLHILLHGDHDLVNSYEVIYQEVRKMAFAGLVGETVNNTNVLQGNGSSKEPMMGDNEVYHYEKNGRRFEKGRVKGARKAE